MACRLADLDLRLGGPSLTPVGFSGLADSLGIPRTPTLPWVRLSAQRLADLAVAFLGVIAAGVPGAQLRLRLLGYRAPYSFLPDLFASLGADRMPHEGGAHGCAPLFGGESASDHIQQVAAVDGAEEVDPPLLGGIHFGGRNLLQDHPLRNTFEAAHPLVNGCREFHPRRGSRIGEVQLDALPGISGLSDVPDVELLVEKRIDISRRQVGRTAKGRAVHTVILRKLRAAVDAANTEGEA